MIPYLALEETKQYIYNAGVPAKGSVNGTTTSEGNPVFFNGQDLWTLKNVLSTASAPATAYDPSIQIDNMISTSSSCANSTTSADTCLLLLYRHKYGLLVVVQYFSQCSKFTLFNRHFESGTIWTNIGEGS
jgi:hypothetical protein